jgi:hypothetical protein
VKGNPYAWDNSNNETYQTVVADNKTGLELFNATSDRSQLVQYNPDWRNNFIRFVPADRSSQLALKLVASSLKTGQFMGCQFYFGDKIRARSSELSSFKTLVVKLRADTVAPVKIGLIDRDAACYTSPVSLSNSWNEVRIPLTSLVPDSMLLLPRPYPGFLPLWFKADVPKISFDELEKLQILVRGEGRGMDVEIASVWLEK